MDLGTHTLQPLFAQLGLGEQPAAIQRFIREHSPLPADMDLCEAPFWSSAQASFLREAMRQDAEWAMAADQLNLSLRDK